MKLYLPLFCSLHLFSFAFSPTSTPLNAPRTYDPWMTGPFLAPTPINMQPGHPALEVAFTVFKTYGRYTSKGHLKKQETIWSLNPFLDFQFALTSRMGIETYLPFISNFKNGQSFSYFQDTDILCGYQIANDTSGSWVPDFRILLQQTFPTGKYQKLSPQKGGIDATGQGAFQTAPVVVFRKLFPFSKTFLSLRGSLSYQFPTTVRVKGYNTYGGDPTTDGKVKPGNTLVAFFSGEYSFTQHWVAAFDTEFFYQGRSHFSGITTVPSSAPPSFQFSIAPEIEYNFNPSSGVLAGVWFTAAGKNASAFVSAFLAYLYVF